MSHDKQWLIAAALAAVGAFLWAHGLAYVDVAFGIFVLVKIWYRLDID